MHYLYTMKHKTITFSLIILCVLSSCSAPDIQLADKASVQISNDLSSKRISCFLEDAYGYIWIGTERGLNRFNGYEYKQYLYNKADTTSLCANIITTLMKDSRGRIWVGTMDGVCRYEGKNHFRRYTIGEEDATVSQVLETSDGTILVNMVRRLYIYNPDEEELEVLIDGFTPQNHFRNRSFLDAADRLWSITPDRVTCYNLHTRQKIKEMPLSIEVEYSEMLPGGNIWVFGRRGKALVNTETMTLESLPAAAESLPTASDLETL